MTDISAAAQMLALLEGWKVFPCRANKKPACKHGFKDATNDLDMIRELFTVPEAVAIGMPTGHVNKAVVIDIDVKNGKLGTKWYEDNRHRLPHTLIHATPSGGLHLVFRMPPNLDIQSSVGTLAPGVDVRACGGYVIWPPSPGYHVEAGANIADLPEWLLVELSTRRPRTATADIAPLVDIDDPTAINIARQFAQHAAAAIEGSGGDTHTYRVACELRDLGVSEESALAILEEHWNPRCEPPWDSDALAKKVQNAFAYANSPPGSKHPGADFGGVTIATVPQAIANNSRIARDPSLKAQIARLASLPVVDYDLCRKSEAKRLGVRISTLDAEVNAVRNLIDDKRLLGRRLELKNPTLWPTPVDARELLKDLSEFFGRHLSLPDGGEALLALWTLHTHCFDVFRDTPRLAVRSPEKGCGKTTVLDLLEMVTARPLSAANITPAAIFRTVEATKPTLLIDEADTFLSRSDELRGILNSGSKCSGQVIRCVGDDSEPSMFATFAPAAIAAIGALPGTIQDRSVTLLMQRALAHERPAGITTQTVTEGAELASRSARWASDNKVALAVPAGMPPGLVNRRADNWRPLITIGAIAGGDWPSKAAAIATAPMGNDDDIDLLTMLLSDLWVIFKEAGADRLATVDLVTQLNLREDRPWPEMPGNKPLSATRLTRMLRPVGAKRRQWRLESSDIRVWGFYWSDLTDSFVRYVGELPK